MKNQRMKPQRIKRKKKNRKKLKYSICYKRILLKCMRRVSVKTTPCRS